MVLYILLGIIAIAVILIGIYFWIANDTYKVIKIEELNSKWKLDIVNRFGNRKEWILSKNSEYGEKIQSGSFMKGSKFSKSSLHGGYKGFTDYAEKNKDLWNNN